MNRSRAVALVGCLLLTAGARAQKPPLLPVKDVAALANELSGETGKRNLEGIARFHRQRGSQGFHEAAELVAERLRAYGLNDVAILQFPADGKIFYGTQRSRPAWNADIGRLSELDQVEATCYEAAHKKTESDEEARKVIAVLLKEDCDPKLHTQNLFASYDAEPVVLAEDSESGEATANLVDVGEGTKESDYAGKAVKGNIVLVGAQPGAVQDLAVGTFGAAGIVSYAQNQKTAWWGEDENLIRWGHLETFSPNKTWAFMVSLKTARAFHERLAKGEKIMLHADVKAGQHPGNYEVVTATISGADPKLKEEEIAFSCHLDHQRPGANDNASGCVTILEVARTLQKLISEGKLARPSRTIRFIFPPEIEGTLALLNGNGRSSVTSTTRSADGTSQVFHERLIVLPGAMLAQRIKTVIHMDMVGGGPETKAVFHVTRGPMSLPSFAHDVAWAFADWVNEESYKFAATGSADYPLVAPEGSKEPLRAEYSAYTMGSDHDVYQDSSFSIPAIYLNDWPDRYIHTNFDSDANIDPTKLKRAAFIGAASGYYLANLTGQGGRAVLSAVMQGRSVRLLSFNSHLEEVPTEERMALQRIMAQYDGGVALSLHRFSPKQNGSFELPSQAPPTTNKEQQPVGDGRLVYSRKREPKGPLAVFGYDYFAVEWAKLAYVIQPGLLKYRGKWGEGEEYAYEVLNFADGKRGAEEIRDAVSAEYGPVPLDLVVEYLKALEKVGIVEAVK